MEIKGGIGARKRQGWFSGGLHARRNPYPLMLALAMGSSSILFVFILVLLVLRKYTLGLAQLTLPAVFGVSTVFIALSSAALALARRHFKAEHYRYHLNWSGIALVLGLCFVSLQLVGWWQLYRSGFTLQDSMAAAFIYLLSGLHLAHLALAIALLFWAVLDSSRNQTYVDGYLQSINPAKRTRLQMAYWFWHFTDALWVLLIAVFYFLLG